MKRYDYYRQIINRDNWFECATDEYPDIKRILRKLVRDAVRASFDELTSTKHRNETWATAAGRIAKELIADDGGGA